jgi:hypothetical protein
MLPACRMTQETRIPLEDFQRHFVFTHMKGAAAGVFDDLKQRAEQSGRSYPELLGEWIKSSIRRMLFKMTTGTSGGTAR